jgi:hypothetical protein
MEALGEVLFRVVENCANVYLNGGREFGPPTPEQVDSYIETSKEFHAKRNGHAMTRSEAVEDMAISASRYDALFMSNS